MTVLVPPDGLIAAYRATNFLVFGEEPVTLRVGHCASAYDDWLSGKGYQSATVVTAWNPFSKQLSDDENRTRQTELLSAVVNAGLRWLSAEGRDPRGQWAPEESLCVFEATNVLVDELLVRFEQHAVVRLELGSECRLVWHPGTRSGLIGAGG